MTPPPLIPSRTAAALPLCPFVLVSLAVTLLVSVAPLFSCPRLLQLDPGTRALSFHPPSLASSPHVAARPSAAAFHTVLPHRRASSIAVSQGRVPWPGVVLADAAPDPAYGPPAQPDDIVLGAFLRFVRHVLDPQNCIGIEAALLEQNEKGGIRGRRLRLEIPGPSSEPVEMTRINNFIERASNYTAVIMSSALLAKHLHRLVNTSGVPVFGPNVLDAEFNVPSAINRHFLHPASSAVGSVGQMVNFAARSVVHAAKYLIVSTPEFGFNPSLDVVRMHLAALGVDPAIEVAVPGFDVNATLAIIRGSMDDMWSASDSTLPSAVRLPQAVFLLTDEDNAAAVINEMYHDPRVDREAMNFFAMHLTTRTRWANATNSSEPFRNFFHASPYPFFNDTRFTVVQQYQKAMLRAFEVYNDTDYRNMSLPYLRGTFDDDSMSGYVAARLAIEAMQRVSPDENLTAANVLSGVYRTRMFRVADLDFGPFTDGCVGQQAPGFMACWCNRGQRRFFTTRIDGETGNPRAVDNDPFVDDAATVNIPPITCAFQGSVFRKLAYVLMPATGPTTPLAHARLTASAHTTLANLRRANIYHPVEVFPLRISGDINGEAVPLHERCCVHARYHVRAFIGDLSEDHAAGDAHANCTSTKRLAFGGWRYQWPLYDPAVTSFEHWSIGRAEIPVYPVMGDMIDAAVDFAAARGALGNVHIVADSSEALHAAQRSLHTRRQVEAASGTIVPLLDDGSPSTGAVLTAVAAATGTVIVASQHVAVLRAVHAAEVASPSPAQDRAVVFATSEFVLEDSLDHGAAALNLSHVFYVSGLRDYGALGNATAAYGSFLAQIVATSLGDLATDEAEPFAFRLGRLATTTAALSPLSATPCPTSGRPLGSTCQCNKGLSTFYIRPLKEWASNPTSDAVHLMTHGGCGVQYVPLPGSSGLSIAATVAIIAACAAVAALVGAAVVYVALQMRDPASKRTRNAPTDARRPFTIVFTDIQASTALWAHAPELMGAALDAHNDVIRRLIAAHKGYEVKTIGDSFMVAFKDPQRAVQFALATQPALFEHPWGTDVFDDAYAVELQGIDDTVQPTPAVWSGPRVRVGVHYGTGDIKFDATARSYDYYGTVVNTAARVEAVGHGGQVLVSQDCFAALLPGNQTPDANETSMVAGEVLLDATVTDLGPQPLRGLDSAVYIYQVLPTAFASRCFPPLRLAVERVVDDDDGAPSERSGPRGGDGSTDSSGTRAVPLEAAAERIVARLRLHTDPAAIAFAYRLLQTVLSAATPKARSDISAEFASKWRVPIQLPWWAQVRAAALLLPSDAFNVSERPTSPNVSGRRSSLAPRTRASKLEDRAAGQMLFTIGRVVSTLEALPDATRPLLVGKRGADAHRNSVIAASAEHSPSAGGTDHDFSGLGPRPTSVGGDMDVFSAKGTDAHEPSLPVLPPVV